MESVLALEVGAAARRIFSRAIWGERRDGKAEGNRGSGHRPPCPPQQGVTGMCMREENPGGITGKGRSSGGRPQGKAPPD